MSSPEYVRSAPAIPREARPFILRRRILTFLAFGGPVLVPLPAVAIGVAGGLPLGYWTCWAAPVLITYLVLLIVLDSSRFFGVRMAADSAGVWVHEQRRGALAIYSPWDNVESVFLMESHRKPLFGREWLIVVRIRHLPDTLRGQPDTLRRQEDPPDGPVTFQISTYLSNHSPGQARVSLAGLAAGRCPVN